MFFSTQIRAAIRPLHLLSHPFYQAWTKGQLTREELQNYAVQYNPFVEAFPRFVSAVHSHCEDASARAEILENLLDEEGKSGRGAAHPALWRDFMAGLGVRDDGQVYHPAATAMKDDFLKLCQASYGQGLCALYAYEYQTPEISKTKIEGLQKFYGMSDLATVEFFRVHETADVYHAQSCEKLIDAIPADQQAAALQAAQTAAGSLWQFLSACYEGKICDRLHC